MSAFSFQAWMKRLGLTQAQAALELGRGARSVWTLLRAPTVPRETEMACKWLEEHPEDRISRGNGDDVEHAPKA